ncbi:hypothetical protein YC2023_122390 [Brassica napus]
MDSRMEVKIPEKTPQARKDPVEEKKEKETWIIDAANMVSLRLYHGILNHIRHHTTDKRSKAIDFDLSSMF